MGYLLYQLVAAGFEPSLRYSKKSDKNASKITARAGWDAYTKQWNEMFFLAGYPDIY